MKALEIDSDNVLALTKKGNSLCHIGQSDLAIKYLNKSLKIDSRNELHSYQKWTTCMI